MEEVKYNQDTVFLALTRPAMIKGVPVEAVMISVAVAGLAMIVTDSIFYLAIAIPLLAGSKMIVKRDQNAFRILMRYLETSARCMNRPLWGGSSCSPMRLCRSYTNEEID